ncbi:hypothetical protein ABW20_dc0101054 [Dactylellina cionopaga]|nr:hypothetical protein ABW20_dc0101054 [Dactylellina cionopaga]
MAESNFEAQIRSLEAELANAESNLYELDRNQTSLIAELNSEYKTRLDGASTSLSSFIEHIWKTDSKLLEYSTDHNDIELERHLEAHESTIRSLNGSVEQAFSQLEVRLVDGEGELMRAQEKATEEGTAKMELFTDKILGTQKDLKGQITATENEIKSSGKEKANATAERDRLKNNLNDMRHRLSELDKRRGEMIGKTTGGSVMAVVGGILTPFFPPLGIGMIAAGSSMAIGSGIGIADTEEKMKRTRSGISDTNNKISKLKIKIENLIAKVPHLKANLGLFDTLMPKVRVLEAKSKAIHSFAHKHVQTIIAAKDSISVGTRKIKELNAHLQLGYRDTREDMANTLEIVVEKLIQGRRQLQGDTGSSDTKQMLDMVGEIAGGTNHILAIMDCGPEKRFTPLVAA